MKMDEKVRGRLARYREGSCGALWEFVEYFTRFWGVATAIVLSGVGVEMAAHRYTAGIFIVLGSLVVFFLEIMWAITLFIDLCTNENEYGGAPRWWDGGVAQCRGARRGPLYVGGALALAAWPGWPWVARAAAGVLLALGALHVAAATLPRAPQPLLPTHRHRLVTDATERCDDGDTAEDAFSMANGDAPSISDQEAILEI